ncbi:MAG: transporter substrate-binding domain-containing protein, partial [Beijerinckiaceae bacterium]
RFLVDDEYPPFHFSRPDGTLTGFSVDLARALCAELKLACTVQARRWDTLLDSLADGRGDAVIAAMKITPDIRARFRVTSPWHRSPARFVTRKDMPLPDISVPGLKGKMVAVVANSAHAAFLRDLMPDTGRAEAPTLDAALALMRQGNADAVFADGVTLSLWLAGGDSADCCQFVGGPYLTIRYFGEGVGIIVRKEESLLKQALDQALVVVADKGIYGELYLKYFPLSFY